MRVSSVEMLARRLAVIDDLAAKLVFADVALLFGRIICPYIKAKENGVTENTTRAL